MKVIYNNIYKDIAMDVKKKFNCKIQKSKDKDIFEIYIDNQIAYSIKDDFDFHKIDFGIFEYSRAQPLATNINRYCLV